MLESMLHQMSTGPSIPPAMEARGLHTLVGVRKVDKPWPNSFTKKVVLYLEGSLLRCWFLHDLAVFVFFPQLNNPCRYQIKVCGYKHNDCWEICRRNASNFNLDDRKLGLHLWRFSLKRNQLLLCYILQWSHNYVFGVSLLPWIVGIRGGHDDVERSLQSLMDMVLGMTNVIVLVQM